MTFVIIIIILFGSAGVMPSYATVSERLAEIGFAFSRNLSLSSKMLQASWIDARLCADHRAFLSSKRSETQSG